MVLAKKEKQKRRKAKTLLREYRMLKRLNKKKQLIAIEQALEKLNSYDYKLLSKKYIDIEEPRDKEIYKELSISESKFYRDLNTALLKFLEAYTGERKGN